MVDGFEPAAGGSPQPAQSHRSGAVPTSGIVPGALLNRRYLIDELIGRGTIAEVYRGFDQVLARSVAVKVFHPGIADSGNISRERTEMQIQANLHDRHLVTLYDAKFGADAESNPRSDALQRTGPDAQLTYLVMELVDGGTLADRIGPNGLAAVDVARVGAAAAAGLAAVHQFGMVHRDIRPSNILLSTAGEVKVSDFGFARELEAERVTAAAAAGFDGSTAYPQPRTGPRWRNRPTHGRLRARAGTAGIPDRAPRIPGPGNGIRSRQAATRTCCPRGTSWELAHPAARHDQRRPGPPTDRSLGRGGAVRPCLARKSTRAATGPSSPTSSVPAQTATKLRPNPRSRAPRPAGHRRRCHRHRRSDPEQRDQQQHPHRDDHHQPNHPADLGGHHHRTHHRDQQGNDHTDTADHTHAARSRNRRKPRHGNEPDPRNTHPMTAHGRPCRSPPNGGDR